jgi:uncharacterized protein YlxP (DUF503 family)
MFVGALRVDLYIRESGSLKDKRKVMRMLLDRTRSRFKVAVAEVGEIDDIKRGGIAVACVGNGEYQVRELLLQVERAIVSWCPAEITGLRRGVERFEGEGAG